VAIFLTGSTGYIGAHIASNLLAGHRDTLNLLVRAPNEQEARERLWHSLQLHMDFHGSIWTPAITRSLCARPIR
jgi:thioester reductase-like protein